MRNILVWRLHAALLVYIFCYIEQTAVGHIVYSNCKTMLTINVPVVYMGRDIWIWMGE
jgi:hypothetical protein